MRKTAIEILDFALSLQGFQPPLRGLTARNTVQLFELNKLQDWVDVTCANCQLEPDSCPFLPREGSVREFHQMKIAYGKEVICDAKVPTPRSEELPGGATQGTPSK
jgi:hypothetical protein